MEKNNLRKYQKEILDIIIKRIKNNEKETFIQMPTGTGKNIIIQELSKLLKDKILLITSRKSLEQQFVESFKDYNNIDIITHNDIVDENRIFKYIILADVENISKEKYEKISLIYKNASIISFCNITPSMLVSKNWLSKKEINYTITLQEVLKNGYINPFQNQSKFEELVLKIFLNFGYKYIDEEEFISTNQGILRPDLVFDVNKNKIIIEIKNYRSEFVSNTLINRAIEKAFSYKKVWENKYKKEIQTILIVSCHVAEEVKQYCYKEKEVLILDISNLIYLSQNNKELMKILAEATSYDIYPIIPLKPIDLRLFELKGKDNLKEEATTNQAINFIDELQNLSPGNDDKNAQKYQDLCVKIIKFLFETEFTRVSEQDNTEDKMFRRDLLCGIKGTSEFWKILIQHYNSRFIVFEFKNYKEEIDQNLVYITGKYLYNAALRNVAIMISRKGFSHNAHNLSIGMLTGEGKLIIDLNDNDIITMLRMKADEQDPSDYLLNKLEDFLMSISK